MKNQNKKLFLIAVTDKEETLNRCYTEVLLELLANNPPFVEEYMIEVHYRLSDENLYKSLDKAIQSEKYEGYIVILDCLEGELCNPNVMFEFGAVYHMNKPFVVLTSHSSEDFPFDVRNLKMVNIPKTIINYICKCGSEGKKPNAQKYFFTDCEIASERAEIIKFLNTVHKQYKVSAEIKGMPDSSSVTNLVLDEIRKIKELLSNTAEYIDGEGAAFSALQESVKSAEFSLRTTRFASESIVANNSTAEQTKFMESLYQTAGLLTDKFDRIICNNHPAKWNDIYNILYYGGNGSKVYVRKHDFSIHFELVVIDEKVGFIHFYQADRESASVGVEKINSTLKIRGSSICQRLANIFDRLHHRDSGNENPEDPSRTLLGIPIRESEWQDSYKNYGCFVVEKSVPKYSPYSNNPERKKYIIRMFKDAFQKWIIDDHNDKVIMAAGIAFVEGNDSFIKQMNGVKLSSKEYKEALGLFEKYQDI